MDLKKNTSFCAYPFVQFSQFNSGEVRLCCNALPRKTSAIETGSIRESFNSQYMQDTRQKMLNGQPVSECADCYHRESMGASSERISQTNLLEKRYKHLWENATAENNTLDQPRWLDLRIGNICNLKCQSCSPLLSNQVALERAAMNVSFHSTFYNAGNWPSKEPGQNFTKIYSYDWDEISQLLNQVDLIKIIGGEPLIAPEMKKFLHACEKSQAQSRLELRLHTNVTRFDSSFLESLKPFRKVKIHFSLDAFGPLNEYIRYPSNWNDIETNLKRYFSFGSQHANFNFAISSVLQIPNYLKILNLAQWVYELAGNYPGLRLALSPIDVTDPPYLSVTHLPDNMKREGLAHVAQFEAEHAANPGLLEFTEEWRIMLRDMLSTESVEKSPKYIAAFRDFILAYDQHRKTNIHDVFPQFNELTSSLNTI